MEKLESYLLKRLLPYDQKLKALAQSLKTKNSEIAVLELAYNDLLQELEKLVGPKQYAEYVRVEDLTASHVNELTPEEQLIMIKTFDFNIPIPESDVSSVDKIKRFREIVEESDFRNLKERSMFQALVNSPEFDLFIYSPDFGVVAGNHDLTAIIKSIQFKKLASTGNFKKILASNGIKLPLNPFDEHLSLKLSHLKSIARRDAIFEDFKVKRQSSLSPTSRDLNFLESPVNVKSTSKQYIKTDLSFSLAASPSVKKVLQRKKSTGLLIERTPFR